jgi:hypothetical protein
MSRKTQEALIRLPFFKKQAISLTERKKEEEVSDNALMKLVSVCSYEAHLIPLNCSSL